MKKQVEKILLKLKDAFKEESEDNFEMLSTYFLWIEGEATDEDLDRANEQLKEIFKNLGLGFFLILPFSPITIPFIFKIAKDYDIPLHVDACLGGFITQYDPDLKISFLDNIQSISVDPHKYGLAPKGSSVLLWKDMSMKKYQYFVVSDWTGGLYASVSLPGSRVGSQIATTWAALLYNGNANYRSMSLKIKNKTLELADKLRNLEHFNVIGHPNVNVVAFYNTKYSVGQLNKYLKSKKWNLNILQHPICLHICITPKNIKYIDTLYSILEKFNEEPVLENNDDDMTAIYGMATEIPDKSIINSLVNYYLHMTTNI